MSLPACAPEPQAWTWHAVHASLAGVLLCCLGAPPVALAADPPRATAAAPAEIIVLNVTLNSEPKGDLFVGRTADLDFLVRVEDLRAMGLREPSGKTVHLEGEPHISLRSMAGVSFTFDERKLALHIAAEPRLLPGSTISLESRRSRATGAPIPSGYFNYALSASGGDAVPGIRLGFTGEAGWRWGNFLLQGDGATVWDADGRRRFVRLMSSVTHDDMTNLRRTVVGDFFTPSRDLSTGVNLGGVSVSKVYTLDPYFVRFPMQSITGNVSLPSELEVYLDGHRIRTQQLRPGEFELRDIVSMGGAQSVQLVLRDPFGRVQQLSYSFYFSDQPLQPGLHEYSYNLGAIRRRYGQESDSYGPGAYTLFHRYGVNRFATIGLRAEGTRKLKNVGPLLTVVLGNAGVVNMAVVRSSIAGHTGSAGSLSYSYQTKGWTLGTSLRHDSRYYAALGDPPSVTNRRYEASLGGSYHLPGNGSISLNHAVLKTRADVQFALPTPSQPFLVLALPPRRTTALTYTAPLLAGRVSLIATLSHIKDQARGSRNEAFVGLTFLLDRDHAVTASSRRDRDQRNESLRWVKSQPVGQGLGYSIGGDHSVEHWIPAASRTSNVDANIQYNAPAAVLRADYTRSRGQQRSFEDYRLSLAGNVSYVGGHTALGRPVTGSFGIAKVGELADVEVLVEGQSMGRTDSHGTIFLPTLNPYFDNEVSINPGTVPIEYSIGALSKKVSPASRAGTLIDFAVTRVQAFSGKISVTRDGETKPAEFLEGTVRGNGKSLKFQTGRGGEFYLENLQPGTYGATVLMDGKECTFEVVIPRLNDTFVQLGDLTCRLAP